MSALRSHRKLLLVAVPLGLVVVAVTALLTVGNDAATEGQPGASISARLDSAPSLGPLNVAQISQSSMRGVGDSGRGAGPGSPSTQPVLRIFRCTPGAVDAAAAQLQEAFGTDSSVRIVPDRRTSQLLVMAPPDVQSRIAKLLPEEQPAESGNPLRGVTLPGASASRAAQAPAGPGSQDVQLWHMSGEQFEASLVRMLASRLTPVTSPQAGSSAYQLTLANGQRLRLSIDRRSNRLRLEGAPAALRAAAQLTHVLDSPQDSADGSMRLVALERAESSDVERMIDALEGSYSSQASGPGLAATATGGTEARLAMAYQQDASSPGAAPPPTPAAPGAPAPDAAGQQPAAPGAAAVTRVPGLGPAEALAEEGGLIGPVQIEIVPGTDIIVVRGKERDVKKVVELIEQIEKISEIEKPVIQVYQLAHVDCRSLATLLKQLYTDVYSARQGTVSITALVKPNAVLLIGRQESVDTVADLIRRLDRPVAPSSQFQVFRLKNTPAESAQESLTTVFPEATNAEEAGLGPRVLVVADFRTNSLVVRASPSDLAEVAAVIQGIDAKDLETVNEVRIFKLKNSLAEDLAPVLQDAITGQMYGQRTGQRALIQPTAGARENFERKSIRLQFLTTDPTGQQALNSGILTDAQVTADTRANALIVTASPDSMPLIAALIADLDELPTAQAEVKVFTVVHGDASSLLSMLQNLFAIQAQATEPAVRTGATGEESSLVYLRFAVDVRTNSIIATGSAGDLLVVESILMRLDESDLRKRKTVVLRLKNASAVVVSQAISDFVTGELTASQPVQGLLSSVEQTEREVVVVPEEITNSLIISATEQFFERIVDLVNELDARPPMVTIQVLIAAVNLNDTDELGAELGLQDSILFDRSLLDAAGDLVPGYLFNSTNSLGNAAGVPDPARVGTQGLTNLSLGRANNDLGYGGFVFSASSESVSVLIRALQEQRRLQLLARPQITTMDNVQATVHVGENVPSISSVAPATQIATQTFDVTYLDVGLQLQVTPRINPDGLVVMEITAIRSEVGPEAEGIPISVAANGAVIRSPRIEIVETQTSVSAMDGQTVIMGGLISTRKQDTHRQVPWLGDVPVLGHLFRFDGVTEERDELLFILTPHVIREEADAERIKRIEAARMHWCYADVLDVNGDIFAPSGDVPVIYPDLDSETPSIPTPAPASPPAATGSQKASPAPAQPTPFIMEPLPAEPGPKEMTPAPPKPAPEQGAAYYPWSPPAAFDRPDPRAAATVPLRYAQAGLPAEGPPAGVEQATYQSPVMAPAVTSPSSWSGR